MRRLGHLKQLGQLLTYGLFSCTLSFNTQAVQEIAVKPNELESNNVNTTYTIGISDINHYPYFSLVKSENRGFAWSVLESFAEQHQITFNYKVIPLSKLQLELEQGGIDFIFPDNPKFNKFKDKANPNIYSSPIAQAVAVTYTSKQKQHYTIDQVRKVAIPFGYTSWQWSEVIRQYNIQTVPVRDLFQGLYALRISNIDATDIEFNIAQHITQQSAYWSQMTIAKNLPSTKVDYHLSSIKHIGVLEDISQFVTNNPGLILELKERYNIKYYDEVFPEE